MTMIKNEWAVVGGSNVNFKTVGSTLEMMSLSPAMPAVITILLISGIIELVLAGSSTNNPNMGMIAITFLFLFIIAPTFSFPWLPCRNHLIVDNANGKLEVLKKNVNRRVISRKTFNINNILDIIIRVDTGYQNSTKYVLILKIEHTGEVKLYNSYILSSVRSVEVLLRSHLKNLVRTKTHIQSSDISIPIYTGDGNSEGRKSDTILPSNDPVFACAIDHSPIEGIVYSCPGCHALLCNACLSVYVARSLGCPRCGKPVLASRSSAETKLLAVMDDRDDKHDDA